MYIYTACDVFFYCFITMRGQPFVVVSLRALHSASGLHHSTDSLVITIFLCVLLWY